MKLEAEFCVSRGDQIDVLGCRTYLPATELRASPDTALSRLEWQLQYMSETLINESRRLPQRQGPFGGRLITHPDDRDDL